MVRVWNAESPDFTRAQYALQQFRYKRVPWMRSCVMVVGEGGAGKTSVRKSLFQEPFDHQHDVTAGIHLDQVDRIVQTEFASGRPKSQGEVVTSAVRSALELDAQATAPPAPSVQLPSSPAAEMDAGATMDPPSDRPAQTEATLAHRGGEGSDRTFSTASPTPSEPHCEPRPLAGHTPDVAQHPVQASAGIDAYLLEKANAQPGDDEALTLSMWDYGGQRVFYALHHLFLKRQAVYVLVFRMTDLLDEPSPTDRRHAVRRGARCPSSKRQRGENRCTVYFEQNGEGPRCAQKFKTAFFVSQYKHCILCGSVCCPNCVPPSGPNTCKTCRLLDEDVKKKKRPEGWKDSLDKAQWDSALKAVIAQRKQRAQDYLVFWLKSILMHARGAPILLVGTRKDQVPTAEFARIHEILEKLLSTLEKARAGLNIKRYRPDCLFFPVNNTKSGDRERDPAIASLDQQIVKSAQGEEYVREKVPAVWMECIDATKSAYAGKDYVQKAKLQRFAQGMGVTDFEPMLLYLHQLGLLLNFKDVEEARDWVILNPRWLIKLIGTVVRDHNITPLKDDASKEIVWETDNATRFYDLLKQGVLARPFLQLLPVWREEEHSAVRDFVVQLMLQFGLLANLDEANFFVPCVLMQENSVPLSEDQANELAQGKQQMHFKVVLTYKDSSPFVPDGLLSRIVAAVLQRGFQRTGDTTEDKIKYHMRLNDVVIEKLKARLLLSDTSLWIEESAEEFCLYVYPKYTKAGTDCLGVLKTLEAMLKDISMHFYRASFAPSFHLCQPDSGTSYLLGTNIESLPEKIPGTGGVGELSVSKATVLEWLHDKATTSIIPPAPAASAAPPAPAIGPDQTTLVASGKDSMASAAISTTWYSRAKAAGAEAMQKSLQWTSTLTDACDGGDALKKSLQTTKVAFTTYAGTVTTPSGDKEKPPGQTAIGSILQAVASVAGLAEVAKAAPVIGGIITVGLEIKALIQGGTQNETQCQLVLQRCEALETAFGLVVEEVLVRKHRGGSENVEHIMTQANAVENVLMEILRLVDGCREKNWVVRCLTAKKFKEDFEKLDKQLTTTIHDLGMSLQVDSFQKIRQILDSTVHLPEKLDAVMDDLKGINEKLDAMMVEQRRQGDEQRRQGDEQRRLSIKLKGIFNHIVGIEDATFPRLVMVLPDAPTDESPGSGSTLVELAKELQRKALTRLKWKQYMRLYILDEGPRLLPGEIPHESEGVPKDGIRIELPGDMLVRMGPMLLMCAKIFCAAASLGGNLTGIPISCNMFGHNATAALETATKFMAEMHNIVSLNEDDLADVNQCMSYLQSEARSDEDGTPQEVKRIFGAGYDTIKKLLTKENGNDRDEWADIKKNKTLVRVHHANTLSVHWVRPKHLDLLAKHGYDVMKETSAVVVGNGAEESKTGPSTGSSVNPGLSSEEPGVFRCIVVKWVRSKIFRKKWSARRLSVLPVSGQKCCHFVLEKDDGSKREEHTVSSQTHFVRPIKGNNNWGCVKLEVFDISFFDMSKGSLLKIGMMSHAQRGDTQKLIAMLQEMEMVSTVKWGVEEDES